MSIPYFKNQGKHLSGKDRGELETIESQLKIIEGQLDDMESGPAREVVWKTLFPLHRARMRLLRKARLRRPKKEKEKR